MGRINRKDGINTHVFFPLLLRFIDKKKKFHNKTIPFVLWWINTLLHIIYYFSALKDPPKKHMYTH